MKLFRNNEGKISSIELKIKILEKSWNLKFVNAVWRQMPTMLWPHEKNDMRKTSELKFKGRETYRMTYNMKN